MESWGLRIRIYADDDEFVEGPGTDVNNVLKGTDVNEFVEGYRC